MTKSNSIAIIGNGAIAKHLSDALPDLGVALGAVIMRANRLKDQPRDAPQWVSRIDDLPADVDLVVDCAGHDALRGLGADILQGGRDLLTVSLGALADDGLHGSLHKAAIEGGSRLHLASGAIGALDALQAAATGGLQKVTYTGRKPPHGWHGSPAEDVLDLSKPLAAPITHFSGTARAAALRYPKNANVAAAVALAGIGFDQTDVALIADPGVSLNVHELEAEGDFGRLTFRIEGKTLPDNPRSSALAAMSVISALSGRSKKIHF